MMIMHLDPNYSIFMHITMVYIFDIKTRVVIFFEDYEIHIWQAFL